MGIRWLTDEEARASQSMKWVAYGDLLPAWVAEMDIEIAAPIKEALHQAVDANMMGYPGRGVPKTVGFNDAVASWHERLFNTHVDPNTVIALPSIITAINLIVEALLEPGDGLILNTPVYHPFFDVVEKGELKLFDVPMLKGDRRYRLDLAKIKASFANGAKAILLCHPHNPTGSMATLEELTALAEIVEEHQGLVISDEVHAPLALDNNRFFSYSTVSQKASLHSITVSSASKAYNMPGLRNAWTFTSNPQYQAALMATPYDSRNGAASLGLVGATAALNLCDDWLADLVEEIAARHDELGHLLAEQLPEASMIRPQAGYLAWVDFSQYPQLGSDPAKWIKDKAGVVLSSGLIFRTGGSGFARINVGTSAERLARIIGKISQAIAKS